jgi:hypothetical protein
VNAVRSSEGTIAARGKSGVDEGVTISFPTPAKHARSAGSAVEEISIGWPKGRTARRRPMISDGSPAGLLRFPVCIVQKVTPLRPLNIAG